MSRRPDRHIAARDIPTCIRCSWCGTKIPFSYLNTVDHRREPTIVISRDDDPDETLYFCASVHRQNYLDASDQSD